MAPCFRLPKLRLKRASASFQKHGVCVECLIGKQKKPILFKVTEPSSIPYRTVTVLRLNFQHGCNYRLNSSDISIKRHQPADV